MMENEECTAAKRGKKRRSLELTSPGSPQRERYHVKQVHRGRGGASMQQFKKKAQVPRKKTRSAKEIVQTESL